MKHFYLLKIKIFISMIIFFVGAVKAHDFAVQNSDGKWIYYKILSSSNGKAVGVTCRGYNSYASYEGTINIPEKVTYQGKEYDVTEISSSTPVKSTSIKFVN